jgi:hypothetical protein
MFIQGALKSSKNIRNPIFYFVQAAHNHIKNKRKKPLIRSFLYSTNKIKTISRKLFGFFMLIDLVL